jgi:hypothetical protein
MDDLAVVGGLVPTLLIPPADLPAGAEAHVGTMDLDLGLDLAILDEQRYAGIAARLRDGGFSPDINNNGNPSRQCWKFNAEPGVKIEFLMPQINVEAKPGRLQPLENGLAAFIIYGLEIAFRNRMFVTLSGQTLFRETATRDIPVCNPGAFVLLKALAFKNRGKFKDAYDLFYMIRNFGAGPEEVAAYARPLIDTEAGHNAINILQTNFHAETAPGPTRAALFHAGEKNVELQADVVGFVSAFLRGALG